MITRELFLVLLAGVISMTLLIAMQMKWYAIESWKSVVVSIALVLTGVFGSQIWFFVENLQFGGRSFYGAIVFSPLVFLPVSKCLRISYGEAMDFVAPAGCFTLALVKIQCLRDRCCEGKVMFVNENHIEVRFPSQVVEMIAFLIISFVLFWISYRSKNKKTVFLWFLIIYGVVRFVLDFCRDVQAPYALGLSAGSFWSLCSFVIGAFLLIIFKRNSRKKRIGSKGAM